jgi:ribonuclease D
LTRRLSLTLDGRNIAVNLHKGDLPAGLAFGPVLAIDTETLGLSLVRDRLCLAQIWDGEGDIHLVQFDRATYAAPHLIALLGDESVTKLFHFARFDVAMIARDLHVVCTPLYCTKIASKLVRTYTDKHGLKDVVRELTGKDISKDQQSSDWGAAELTDAQIAYAASDVLHLHAVKHRLDIMLARENRTEIAAACFAFLPTRAALDLAGWEDQDIFAHS